MHSVPIVLGAILVAVVGALVLLSVIPVGALLTGALVVLAGVGARTCSRGRSRASRTQGIVRLLSAHGTRSGISASSRRGRHCPSRSDGTAGHDHRAGHGGVATQTRGSGDEPDLITILTLNTLGAPQGRRRLRRRCCEVASTSRCSCAAIWVGITRSTPRAEPSGWFGRSRMRRVPCRPSWRCTRFRRSDKLLLTRRAELPRIVGRCDERPRTIMAGDFNATLDHPGMRKLGGCRDAAQQLGGAAPST